MSTRKFGVLELIAILGIVALVVGGGYSFWKLNSEKSPRGSAKENSNKNEINATSTLSSKPTTVVSTPKQKLRLISPNGGEVWERSKQYNVRWTSEFSEKTRITAVIFKTSRVVTNPYTSAGIVTGFEMFSPAVFPAATNEGSFVYRVSDSLATGKYQILLWAGENCSPTDRLRRCDFDLSNNLFTIK